MHEKGNARKEIRRMNRSRREDAYRRDEEIYVYDQCCENCARHNGGCPLEIRKNDSEAAVRRKKKLESEDATHENGAVTWCVNWKQKKQTKQKKERW